MLRKTLSMLFVVLGLIAMPVTFAGCQDGPAEEAGEALDDFGDDVEDTVD